MTTEDFTPPPVDPAPDGYLPPVLATDPPGLTPAPVALPPAPPVTAPPGGKVITLPSGFTVALRNPKAIRNRERKYVYEGLADGMANESMAAKIELGFQMTNRILALLISAWDVRSVDDELAPFGPVLPVPRDDLAGLDDLPMGDVSVLEKEADEARKIIMPDFSPSPNPASPTAPSAG